LLVMRFGWMTEAQQKEVLALELGEHQRTRNPVEHIRRRRTAASLFKPCVPGRADGGALRDFLAPQSRRPAALRRNPQCDRIECGPACSQVSSEQAVVGDDL